jgi:hypothetical protein
VGALVAGIALGSLSMKTKSIYQGFLVHITVAGRPREEDALRTLERIDYRGVMGAPSRTELVALVEAERKDTTPPGSGDQ